MKKLTKAQEKLIEKNALYSKDGQGTEAKVIIKFFGGSGYTFLATEGEKLDNGDFRLFGWATMNNCDYECGHQLISELLALRFRPFNLGIEIDRYAEGQSVKELIK